MDDTKRTADEERDDRAPNAHEEPVEDLEVPDDDRDAVKGGTTAKRLRAGYDTVDL